MKQSLGTIQILQQVHIKHCVMSINPIVLRSLHPSLSQVSKYIKLKTHSVHSVHQRHLLHQALRALSNRVVSIVHGLLWPTSRQRVRVRVAHPTIVLNGVPRIANVRTFVE